MRLLRLSISWLLLPGIIAGMACANPRQVSPRGSLAVAAPVVPVAGVAVRETPSPRRVDFARQVQPILSARCQPCHFPGGKVYGPMPFDRAETVLRLREKLFTRIKDEEPRRSIREFLAQNPAADSSAGPSARGR